MNKKFKFVVALIPAIIAVILALAARAVLYTVTLPLLDFPIVLYIIMLGIAALGALGALGAFVSAKISNPPTVYIVSHAARRAHLCKNCGSAGCIKGFSEFSVMRRGKVVARGLCSQCAKDIVARYILVPSENMRKKTFREILDSED